VNNLSLKVPCAFTEPYAAITYSRGPVSAKINLKFLEIIHHYELLMLLDYKSADCQVFHSFILNRFKAVYLELTIV
jgi:hypothetical protein